MIKRFGVTTFILVALLALDVRSDLQFAAEPQAQIPEHVADEVIVRFRDGVDQWHKGASLAFAYLVTRKKIFRTVRGLEVVKLSRNVSVQDAIDLFKRGARGPVCRTELHSQTQCQSRRDCNSQ